LKNSANTVVSGRFCENNTVLLQVYNSTKLIHETKREEEEGWMIMKLPHIKWRLFAKHRAKKLPVLF